MFLVVFHCDETREKESLFSSIVFFFLTLI